MFSIERREGALPTLELRDSEAGSAATLAPSRGGMPTALHLRGRSLLYLDGATFADRSANVRGGNPVLFPSPGKLAGDAWERAGQRGAMKQHGFARNLPWEVIETGND